jgi:hypothetical protein
MSLTLDPKNDACGGGGTSDLATRPTTFVGQLT